MQKEIIFDALTAQEVAQRLERLKVLQNEIDVHTTALNAVVLTTGRMSGCAPTDRLGLNEGGTGVVVMPAEQPQEGDAAEVSDLPAAAAVRTRAK